MEDALMVVMPKTIHWYTQPSRLAPVAAKLEEGETYYFRIESTDIRSPNLKEELVGWPTYKKGWRYCVPLYLYREGEGPPSTEERLAAQPYYVRLEDAAAIFEAAHTQGGVKRDYAYTDRSGDFADQTLYRGGAYISPDMYREVWDFPNTLMAAGAAGIVAFNVFVGVRDKKRSRNGSK